MLRRRRRSFAAALAASAVAAVALVSFTSTPTFAAYGVVADGLVQWEWSAVPDPAEMQVMDVAVRPDGWLVVSTGYRFDGHLHLIPPWGGMLGPDTRLGEETHTFRQLEFVDGRLFGMRTDPDRTFAGSGIIDEVDPETGAYLRTVGEYWYQDMTVDPQTGDLVVQDYDPTEPTFAHPVVRVDPESGRHDVIIPDGDPRADQALQLAFSPDGEFLYAGHATGNQIDVHGRDGTLLHSLQTGGPIDDLVAGQPGTCLAGSVVYTRSDGTAWVFRDPGNPLNSAGLLAGGGRAPAVSYAALDLDGNVLTPRLADVTLLACEPFTPPEPPVDVPPPPPVTAPPVEVAAPPPAEPPPPPPQTPAAASQPAPSPPAQPPPAPPTPNFASPAQLSAPNAGIADSPESQPVLSLSASTRLLLGAGAVTAMAAGTYTATHPHPRLQPVHHSHRSHRRR